MAECTLDLSHPCFLASMGRLQDDPETQEALAEIKSKVEREHTSCNRVVQKFYGNSKFPHLQGKIWKYDWGKSSASGRKSWRLVVVVAEPNTQPYKLIAGALYFKNATEQLPLRELNEIFTCVTTQVAATNVLQIAAGGGEFHRVPNGDGQTRSICMHCYFPAGVSDDPTEIDRLEQEHRCDLASESN